VASPARERSAKQPVPQPAPAVVTSPQGRKGAIPGDTVSLLNQADGPTRAEMLMELQRSQGNEQVQRMLTGMPSRSSGGLPPVPVQRAAPEAPPAAPAASGRDVLEGVRARALVRMGKLSALEMESADVIDSVKDRLLRFSDQYGIAYERYAKVMEQGKQAAEREEEFIGVAIAIGVGLAIALVPELLVGVAAEEGAAATVEAAGTHALTLGKAGVELGKEVGKEVGAKAIEKGVVHVDGSDLAPGGISPEVVNTTVWKSLNSFHQARPRIGAQSMNQALIMSGAEYMIGEFKGAGGAQSDMGFGAQVEMAISLENADAAGTALDAQVDLLRGKIAALKGWVAGEMTYSVDQMEKDIFLLWMATLKKGSSTLDIDAIEDYIGPKGLKLIDFGLWTTQKDQDDAIDMAIARKDGILARAVMAAPGMHLSE